MYCQLVGRRRCSGASIVRMKECASSGLQDHPKGRRLVWRGPKGDCRTKEPRTLGGREIDQKQFAMSNFVNRTGDEDREKESDSKRGSWKEGGLEERERNGVLFCLRSQMSRAFVSDLYVRNVGAPRDM